MYTKINLMSINKQLKKKDWLTYIKIGQKQHEELISLAWDKEVPSKYISDNLTSTNFYADNLNWKMSKY